MGARKHREPPTFRQFGTHAAKYGSELVYETAVEEGLGTEDRARLSARLRRINPSWRPPSAERNQLAQELDKLGWPTLLILAATGLSKSRFYELRREWRA